MNRITKILKYIKNFPKIKRCKLEAIKVKNKGYYDHIPGQMGLVNNIINNPEKYYEEFEGYDMEIYIDYLIYRDQSVS